MRFIYLDTCSQIGIVIIHPLAMLHFRDETSRPTHACICLVPDIDHSIAACGVVGAVTHGTMFPMIYLYIAYFHLGCTEHAYKKGVSLNSELRAQCLRNPEHTT